MKKLGEITSLITKGTTPQNFINKGIKFIKIECFNGDKIDFNKCLFIEEKVHNKELKRSILKENDLLFAIAGATIGKVNIVEKEILPANTNQALAIIRLQEKENILFIYQILKSEIMKKYIKDSISVGAQPNLNLEQMNKFSFFYPSLSEQNKIASFLSIIDNRIMTQKKIIEGLEKSMKGFREKIFSQKLRFMDENRNEFPDWETIKLKNLCEIKKGEQLNKEELTVEGSYPCINGGINYSGFTNKYNSEGNIITISEGGNSCGYVNFMVSKFWLGGHCYKILLNKYFNEIYFYHLLKFNEQRIMNLRVGSGLPNIQQKDLKNLDLFVSRQINEQTKISNFLFSIDEKIEKEKKILVQYGIQKKYLLSNLFI